MRCLTISMMVGKVLRYPDKSKYIQTYKIATVKRNGVKILGLNVSTVSWNCTDFLSVVIKMTDETIRPGTTREGSGVIEMTFLILHTAQKIKVQVLPLWVM